MPADLETPELSSESDSEREDNTRDGVVDPHRMLALSVIQQAITDGATHWFFSSYSRASFEFWCRVAQLQPSWVQKRIGTAESESAHCPGLELRGRTWYLQIYHAGERKIIKVGRDLDRQAAVHIAKAQREAVKNGKVMAALVCGQGSG